jgi:NTP pyrophosphatase (non-canonical NTP hydrolase)
MGNFEDIKGDDFYQKKMDAMSCSDFEEVSDVIREHYDAQIEERDDRLHTLVPRGGGCCGGMGDIAFPLTDQFKIHVAKLFVKFEGDKTLRMHHAATGLAGEGGELLDASKKHWVYGADLDEENVLEECGDALFYIQAALTEIGMTLEDAMKHNMDKLAKRYPEGYTDESARERLDKIDD